jgi:hypothetical protein
MSEEEEYEEEYEERWRLGERDRSILAKIQDVKSRPIMTP